VSGSGGPTLIVVDSSYTFSMIKERGLEYSVTCRDLEGYFGHVYSVNPLASAVVTAESQTKAQLPVVRMTDHHTFIETRPSSHEPKRFSALAGTFAFLSSQVRLIKMLHKIGSTHRPVAVRAGDPLYCGLFGLVLARWLRCPFVVRVGSNNDEIRASTGRALMPRLLRLGAVERRVERLVLSHANTVMGANSDNLTWALKSGADPATSVIVRYGNLIAPEHFSEPTGRGVPEGLFRKLGLSPTDALVLYVGRFEPVKRASDVIEVVARLRQRGIDLVCLMVGDGSQRFALEQDCRDRGLQANVKFGGSLDQTTLAQLNAMAACVVSPHTGRALSEAALAGAPIVAYDVDWQGELIVDKETGRLVPFADVEGLADATADLLTNPDKSRRLGAAVRDRALSMLDPRHGNFAERRIYARLLFGRSPHGEASGPSEGGS
jgi:glycosyltransferase involved in cell wall biosynthesis